MVSRRGGQSKFATYTTKQRTSQMSEKQIELRRKRSRRKKMLKLKGRLAKAKSGGDRDTLLKKIHRISPFWQEPAAAK
jgi:hypothetical protein